eukprot:1074882-Amphidinium_carterae.1
MTGSSLSNHHDPDHYDRYYLLRAILGMSCFEGSQLPFVTTRRVLLVILERNGTANRGTTEVTATHTQFGPWQMLQGVGQISKSGSLALEFTKYTRCVCVADRNSSDFVRSPGGHATPKGCSKLALFWCTQVCNLTLLPGQT